MDPTYGSTDNQYHQNYDNNPFCNQYQNPYDFQFNNNPNDFGEFGQNNDFPQPNNFHNPPSQQPPTRDFYNPYSNINVSIPSYELNRPVNPPSSHNNSRTHNFGDFPSPAQQNQRAPQNIQTKKNPEDTLKAFIEVSRQKLQEAETLKRNNLKEAILTLEKSEKSLIKMLEVVNKKQEFQRYGPLVEEIKGKMSRKLFEYLNEVYTFSSSGFFSFRPKPEKMEIQHYLLSYRAKTYVTENEIFLDKKKDAFDKLTKYWNGSLGSNRKSIIIYGPKGSGKSLIAQKFALETGCYFLQIDSFELLNVPNLVVGILRYLGSLYPVVIYLKKIEKMWENPKLIYFLLENAAENRFSQFKFILLLSSDQTRQFIPKDVFYKLGNKFLYVPPCINKAPYIKFLCEKFNVKSNISESEYNQLNFDLKFYSNEQIYQAFYKVYMNKFKENSGEDISYFELTNQLENVQPDWSSEYLNSFI